MTRVPGSPALSARSIGVLRSSACRPIRPFLPVLALPLLAFVACTDESSPGAGEEAADVVATPAAGDASSEADRLALLLDPTDPRWSAEAPATYRARFETNEGHFVIEVERALAPIGADRFYNLVRHGFYDDQRFTRVLDGYIAQWGLHGDPRVTAVWKDVTIPDDPVVRGNTRGTLGFAMRGPDDRQTQVYINIGDNSRNDAEGFATFGTVVEGMAVVDSLYSGYGNDAGGGMRAGMQGPVEEGGNEYLAQNYPLLDYIIRAYIEGDTAQ
jgi:homoserine O-acetyltransferase